jgi:hypothetical protein
MSYLSAVKKLIKNNKPVETSASKKIRLGRRLSFYPDDVPKPFKMDKIKQHPKKDNVFIVTFKKGTSVAKKLTNRKNVVKAILQPIRYYDYKNLKGVKMYKDMVVIEVKPSATNSQKVAERVVNKINKDIALIIKEMNKSINN